MRTTLLFCLIPFIGWCQQVDYDLKEALKHPAKVYTLDLSKRILLPENYTRLGEFVYLQELKLQENNIDSLPESFGGLKSLYKFTSIKNPLKSFPSSVANCSNLSTIQLVDSEMDSLPDALTSCYRLERLYIIRNKNQLNISQKFDQLTELQHVHIQETKLDSLKANWGNFDQMQKLTLVHTELEHIATLGRLNKLKELVLDHNNLNELPKDFTRLSNLEVLSIQANPISSLPDEIMYLQNLRSLDIRGCLFSKYDVDVLQALLPNCKIYWEETK